MAQEEMTPPRPEHHEPPDPAAQESRLEKERITRRTFLMNIGIAMNAAVGIAIAVPAVAYVLGPVLRKKDNYLAWVDLGAISQFKAGETALVRFRNPYTTDWDGETANITAYVRVIPGQVTVFAVNCAHLGCPVRWFSESQLFMCPCHGGVYYADGSRASGPPERGLFTYPTRMDNGHLFIDAGQMPTLSNQASAKPCPPLGTRPSEPALVTRIEPCPGTKAPTIG